MNLENFLVQHGYHKVPFTLTATNHLEVAAMVNGTAGRFLIDTGASSTCIGIDRVAHFGLNSENSDVKAAGAGATDMETSVSSGNEIQISEWTLSDQQIVLFDLSHVNQALLAHEAEVVDGILGGDLLEEAKAVIDYNKHDIYLKRKNIV